MSSVYSSIAPTDPSVLGRVAVLLGGVSAEREISLKSGAAIVKALAGAGVDVSAIDIQEDAVAQLSQLQADVVFIALHGTAGEDGKIQALLEWLKLPYTGSGVAASALAMNKIKTKQVWTAVGLPTPAYAILNRESDWAEVLLDLGGDVFVKPIHEGSSLGMSCASSAKELADAYDLAATFDSEVLAEATIKGREFTVAILNGVALPPIELKTDHRFYDYDAKYVSVDTVYECPCSLGNDRQEELKVLALKAFDSIGCEYWGRVDFMQDSKGNFFLLEVNTVPGMTDKSLMPMAAKAAGLEFAELLKEILFLAKPPCS